jgi:alkaline phosphatase D
VASNRSWTRRELLLTTAPSAVIAVLVGACSNQTDTLSRDDNTQPPDSGPDAGVSADAEPPKDAHAPDTSASMDAGAPDVGSEPDSGEGDADIIDAGGGPGPETIVESMAFGLGIASGDVTEAGAVLWTRYSASEPLHLWLYRADNVTLSSEIITQTVTPRSGGFVHVDVGGLDAGARYVYVFVEGPSDAPIGRSPLGRFRTAIASDSMEPLIIGAVSCTSNSREPETLARAGARTDLDCFLLLGDTTYNDGARSLTEYRDKWAENLAKDGYLRLRRATSVTATWDDHEVDNNWNPETLSSGQLSASTRAFFDNLPLRRHPVEPDRIYKTLKWGKTAEIFVLDCRGERKPSTRLTPQAEYISAAQMSWLKGALLDSDAVFKLVMNSVPITDLPPLLDLAANDRWEGYRPQRDEIVDHIDSNQISGVLWISGDLHLAYAGRLAERGRGSSQIEILAGPGAQAANPLSGVLRARPQQFDWASAENNYLALHLDPVARRVRVVHHDRADAAISGVEYQV